MPCTLEDVYGYRSPSGTLTGVAAAQILAVPSSSTFVYDYGGTWRPGNGLNPSVAGGDPALRYGVVTQTDGTGAWSMVLPYGATETEPAQPLARWTLLFPDGSTLVGVVPDVAGPLSVRDLVQTYDWVWSSQVYVATVTQGQFAKGTATFTGASPSATIVFLTPFSGSGYQIQLTASADTSNGSIVSVAHANKTTTGFDILVGNNSFVGTVDWEASL